MKKVNNIIKNGEEDLIKLLDSFVGIYVKF